MAVTPTAPEFRRARAAVLISGRGTTMEALVKASQAPDYPAEIVAVLSDNTQAPGLALAAQYGIPVACVTRRAHASRADHETALTARLAEHAPDLLCLAGYMRVLSPEFLKKWPNILNIHPSLLPAHKGLDTHARVLEAKEPATGCTVHIATAGVDEGPILAQTVVEVRPDDTPETLKARVDAAGYRLYPKALADFLLATPAARG